MRLHVGGGTKTPGEPTLEQQRDEGKRAKGYLPNVKRLG